MKETDKNKEVARQFVEEVLNKGNLGLVDKLFADNYANHSLPPGVPTSRDGFKKLAMMIGSAFSNLHVKIEDMIAEDDKVAFRDTTTGTHNGAFMGIAPTGKKITWTEMHLLRVKNGKVTEHWMEANQLGMLQQLGAVPAA